MTSKQTPSAAPVHGLVRQFDASELTDSKGSWRCAIGVHSWGMWSRPTDFGFDWFQFRKCRRCGIVRQRKVGPAAGRHIPPGTETLTEMQMEARHLSTPESSESWKSIERAKEEEQ